MSSTASPQIHWLNEALGSSGHAGIEIGTLVQQLTSWWSHLTYAFSLTQICLTRAYLRNVF